MNKKWKPTHRILLNDGETETVMICEEEPNNGPAYTESEWNCCSFADYEVTDGAWTRNGEAFAGRVERISNTLHWRIAMSYHVLTCNGYRWEETHQTIDAAIEACREREMRANDGFARVVSLDGRLVADADGAWNLAPEVDPMDVALERRFD